MNHDNFIVKPGAKFSLKDHEDINNYEKYLTNNGTVILKFFLNISKSEQKKRAWKKRKFSISDVEERAYWDDYMEADTWTYSIILVLTGRQGILFQVTSWL